MSRIVVFNSVTLDGVMQAPARPDEDPRGGFQHGGWAVPYSDAVIGSFAGESMATGGGLLFGRRTYEDLYSVWPKRSDNPYTEILNNSPKYVVSTTMKEPLPWQTRHCSRVRRPTRSPSSNSSRAKTWSSWGAGS